MLVENGQKLHESGRFVNQQWLWFNVAAMVAAIIGGQLVQRLPPDVGPARRGGASSASRHSCVITGALFLIPEQKVAINLQGMRNTFDGLMASFQRRELWIIAGFMFLY